MRCRKPIVIKTTCAGVVAQKIAGQSGSHRATSMLRCAKRAVEVATCGIDAVGRGVKRCQPLAFASKGIARNLRVDGRAVD